MSDPDLEELLAGMCWDPRLSVLNGLAPFRALLGGDDGSRARDFLLGALWRVEGRRRAGVAFALAEYYRATGDVPAMSRLFETDDPDVWDYGLNALWSEPGPDPAMQYLIVSLALRGAAHPSAAVRSQAAAVIRNQSAWGTDVSAGIDVVRDLLRDESAAVRQHAACAVGTLARRRRYDLAGYVAPLCPLLCDETPFVRAAAAWAMRKLAQRTDIADATPALARLLTADNDEYNEPRKSAAGALLAHARKSWAARAAVSEALAEADPDVNRETTRLLEQLRTPLDRGAS